MAVVPVTQKQIARELGLSIVAVSQALGHRGQLATATRQRVLETAQRMGYRPNAGAKALRGGRFNAIGLLLSTHFGRSTMPERLLLGLTMQLGEVRQQLVIGQMPDAALQDQQDLPRILSEWSCDGLLIDYTHDFPPAMASIVDRMPAVWLNARREHDAVYPDDFEAAVRMTRTLQSAGFRRIHYVCHVGPGHYSVTDRREGYEQAMREAGLEPVVSMQTGASREPRLASVRRVLAEGRPEAVLTYSPRSLGYLWHAAQEMGLRLPGDVTFATFQDRTMTIGPRQLPTMVIPYAGLSRLAVTMVMGKIGGPAEPCGSQAVRYRLAPGDPEWLAGRAPMAPPPR